MRIHLIHNPANQNKNFFNEKYIFERTIEISAHQYFNLKSESLHQCPLYFIYGKKENCLKLFLVF